MIQVGQASACPVLTSSSTAKFKRRQAEACPTKTALVVRYPPELSECALIQLLGFFVLIEEPKGI
jgi:hypothetical protein